MTIKQKNRIFLGGFTVLVLISYQFSFKKTLALRTSINQLKEDKIQLENAGDNLQTLQQQNVYLNNILRSNNVSATLSYEQNLLQKVTQLKREHRVKILSLDEPHESEMDGTTMQSYTIEVKGDYRNLMLFSSGLEQQRLGKFASVVFEKKLNVKTRRIEIICKILLQRLRK